MMQLPEHYTPLSSREHLLGLLAEASEIEHNLMCCYLYAAFSLKQSTDEGVSAPELTAITRWRRLILDVAIEEMGHLTLVANIMSALGGMPHFGRQNFPIAAGYHPSGIVVKLAPFNVNTLDHFIYLERPDGSEVLDGAGFEAPVRYVREQAAGRVMPSAQDYETVGQLYAAIVEGLSRLSGEMGEDVMFCGDPKRQIGGDLVQIGGVSRVTCLKTALAAIDHIVLQGEGSPAHLEVSHFQKFLTIRSEYQRILDETPNFVPARPAAHNPLMRRPPDASGRVWVSAEPAAQLLDVANAAYNHMLRMLLQSYAETRGPTAQRAMVDAAIDLMYIVAPIASLLTRYPANPESPGCTAGMSFATLRATTALPPGASADKILVARLREIESAADAVSSEVAEISGVQEALGSLASRLEGALERIVDEPQAIISISEPLKRSLPPTPNMDQDAEIVVGTAITLHFNARRCIHARHCVLGEPNVFKANVEGPWINPDATSTEDLVTVAHMCPSGAIQYSRNDGGEEEQVPLVNLVQIRENGPLGMRGDLMLKGKTIGMRATLCRCGASMNKPFCDGSHVAIGFTATGEPATGITDPLDARDGPVMIEPQRNGPLAVTGNLEICAGTGRTISRTTGARLCRCGQSGNKPFCDGSHARAGFEADP
jgi:CDGSH-type Zn-finger protein/uncharacterized Fe-S cluster protein YjdI